jgi:TolA-binding protein
MSAKNLSPCPERHEALDRYLAGGEMSAGLEAHIETCHACRRYAQRLRGLESFLRRAHDDFENMKPGALDEGRRLVPHKVAAWAVVLVVVAAGAYYITSATRGRPVGPPQQTVASEAPVSAEGRVVLTTGTPTTLECGPAHRETARIGSRVGQGCLLDVPPSGGVAVHFDTGLTVLAAADSRFAMVESTSIDQLVRVDRGRVSFHSETAATHSRLTVRAGGDRIAAHGRLMSVRVNSERLVRVTAVEGNLTVHGSDGSTVHLRGGQSMDGASRSVHSAARQDDGRAVVLDLLAGDRARSTLTVLASREVRVRVDGLSLGSTPLSVMIAEGTHDVSLVTDDGTLLLEERVRLTYGREKRVVYEEPYAVAETQTSTQPAPSDTGPPPSGRSGGEPVDIVALIREALAAGDTAEALSLVEKHWSSNRKDPDFLGAAGDTYRKLGRHEDAVEAYTGAAKKGEGASAEKAYLAAARIVLENLRDVSAAQEILGTYWRRFPDGFYSNEASLLTARVLVKQKRYAEARGQLEALLAASPQGYLATKAHLLLGSILVTYLSDCALARPHLQAVKSAAPGGKYASEADRFLDVCDVQ